MSFSNGYSAGFDVAAVAPPEPGPPSWMSASIWGFIQWNPTIAVITRRQRVGTAAGGWIWQGVGDLPEQVLRMWPVDGRPLERVRTDGQVQVPDWHIIGDLGLDIEEGDIFAMDDGQSGVRQVEVIFVRRDQYAVRAEAIESRVVT